jgi:hypothetical protein
MQANANDMSGTRCGQLQCSMDDSIVCKGHQDKKIILPNVKHKVEDATPGQGKNTKVVGLPCIWGMVLA